MPDLFSNRLVITTGVLALFGVITFILAAVTLGTLNKQHNELKGLLNVVTTTTTTITSTTRPSLNSTLAELIRIEDLMDHLNALQSIANSSSNTRAIGTPGFDKTLNYIIDYLSKNAPALNVIRQQYLIQNFSVSGEPTLQLIVNDNPTPFIYSTDLAKSEFTYVNYSAPINLTRLNYTVVSNYGCNISDWKNVTGRAALVMAGGPCTYAEKGELAGYHNASALLFYNNGEKTSNLAPASVRLRQANKLPALFLSYAAGQKLINEATQSNVTISLAIALANYSSFFVENICADTKDGNITRTIVVGSHSDSVPAGPGINDNGSGTAATLALATNLAHLYDSGTYTKYEYRVRFCRWGAEEIGLAGSIYHVQQAEMSNATAGDRLENYLINLNYDMLGSPNYMFGIYNGSSAKPDTPQKAINGSIKISETFRNWFMGQNLPWDYTDFSGRSDYGPFLAAGIVAGGLFSGADETKTSEQRLKYESALGQGQGGLAGAILDPCYHQACDTVDNINQYGYEKMVQAAAYMLEHLGRMEDLEGWLYPNGRSQARLPDNYFPNSDYF